MQSITKMTFLVVGALAAVTTAQDLSAFPDCAQWCIGSMQAAGKLPELGCNAGDNTCLCRNPNFTYGVRDCAAELCASVTPAEMALGYVNQFCQAQGVQLSTVTSGLPATFTESVGAGNATGASGGISGAIPISTAEFTSTITTDGSTLISTGASTVFSTPTAVSSILSSLSGAVSTIVSDGQTKLSTITSQVGSATSAVESSDASSTETAHETASSSSSSGYAPQMTAAPVGMLAVAGVAAFLL